MYYFYDFLQGNETKLPLVPPKRGDMLFMVPQGVRPVVQLTMIEVNYDLNLFELTYNMLQYLFDLS